MVCSHLLLAALVIFIYPCHGYPTNNHAIGSKKLPSLIEFLNSNYINLPGSGDIDCDDATLMTCGAFCVPASQKCDYIIDCTDGRDEVPCCEDGFYSCLDGRCIEKEHACDGTFDCDSGLDEFFCNNDLEKNKGCSLPCMVPTVVDGVTFCERDSSCLERKGHASSFNGDIGNLLVQYLNQKLAPINQKLAPKTGNSKPANQNQTATTTTTTAPPLCSIEPVTYAVTCVKKGKYYVDGEQITNNKDDKWKKASELDIPSGAKVLAVHCDNDNKPNLKGFLGSTKDGDEMLTGTAGWVCSDSEEADWETVEFDDSNWVAPEVKGKNGDDPWENKLANGPVGISKDAEWIWKGSGDEVWCRYDLCK